MERFDLIVIGSGMGGFLASAKAASLGAKVALIERSRLGGTCINFGCFPTKALLRAGEVMHEARQGAKWGFEAEVRLDFHRLMQIKSEIVRSIVSDLEATLSSYPNLTYLPGEASFTSPWELDLGGELIGAEKIILAAGSRPAIPPVEGLAGSGYLTNKEILDLTELPETLVIVGGGAVALEFAQMFSRFGTRVTVLQRSPRILPQEDEEATELLTRCLREEGIRVETEVNATSAGVRDGKRWVTARTPEGEQTFEGDQLLVATGRVPDLEHLRLDRAGVRMVDGRIWVGPRLETSADHIWCLGDVTGGPAFAHYATYSAELAVENALLGRDKEVPHALVPGAVFTSPNLASVGMTERAAREQGLPIRVSRIGLQESGKARIFQETNGFVKLVVDEETERILGATIIGFHAGDLIQEVMVALSAPGNGIGPIVDALHVHPSLGEAVRAAAASLRLAFRHAPVGA